MPLTESVSAKIRAELDGQGVSYRELARRLNVSQPWVSRRLADPAEVQLNVADIDAIATALEVPATRFLPGSDRFPWDQASDNVLANEAALDPNDHSPAAEYVREVAGSVRDHRSVRAGSK